MPNETQLGSTWWTLWFAYSTRNWRHNFYYASSTASPRHRYTKPNRSFHNEQLPPLCCWTPLSCWTVDHRWNTTVTLAGWWKNNKKKSQMFNLRRTPSHQRILPAFTRIKFHFPIVHIIRSTLHGIFRWNINANASGPDVFAGNSTDRWNVFLK